MTERNAKVWLQRGRYEILNGAPFFGYGAMKLTFKEDSTLPTLATDGQFIRYNPDYVEKTSTPEFPAYVWAKSEVLHEVMHGMFGHCKDWKARGLDPALANRAQDYVINLMIDKMGYPVHPTWLFDRKYAGMTWQEVYDILKKEQDAGASLPQPHCVILVQPSAGEVDGKEDGEGSGGGKSGDKEDEKDKKPAQDGIGSGESSGEDDGEGSGSGSSDGQKLPENGPSTPKADAKPSKWNDWDRIVLEAATWAESIGKLPAEMRDYAREIVKPRYNWRATLYRFMSVAKKGAYSFRRPNKRYIAQGIVMPSLHSWTADAVLLVDSSGSTIPFLPGFLGCVAEISRVLGVPVDVAQLDTKIQNVFKLKRPDDVKKLAKDIGGGTDFRPGFEWIQKRGRKPEVVIFFTDGEGTYPDTPPSYKVIWCIPDAARLKKENPDYYPRFGTVIDVPSKDLK